MTVSFCGDGEQLWNSTQFLTSPWPQTSVCFRFSVLVWLPCGWLWLALPFHLHFLLLRHKAGTIATNALSLAKMVVSAALCILAIVEVNRAALNASSRDQTLAPVYWQAFAVSLASYALTLLLVQMERLHGLATSCTLWVFWVLSVLVAVVGFYSNICTEEYETDKLLFSVFYIKFFCLCAQLVLASFVDKSAFLTLYASCPELLASVPSRLFFCWISSFMVKTYRRGLQEEDMFDLHPRDEVASVAPQFEGRWREELERHPGFGERPHSDGLGYSSFDSIRYNNSFSRDRVEGEEEEEAAPLLSWTTTNGAGNNGRKASKPSLMKVLFQTYAVEILQSHLLMLVFDLLQFANPFLLGALIGYVQDRRLAREGTQQWPGYVIALGFFMTGLVSSVALNQCYHLGLTLGMRVKNALWVAVFKKILASPRGVSQRAKLEETANLVSRDCHRMQDLMGYLWMVWSVPLEIVLASGLLWHVVGHSMLWGLLVMALVVPVNAYVTRRQKVNLGELARVKRRRMALTRELVEGIQVYKMLTWENMFQQWVERIRWEEIKILRRSFLNTAISSLCWACSPLLVLLATFASYAMTSDATPLDAYRIFVCLSLFNILRYPVNLVPMLLSLLYQSVFTVNRLNKHLTSANARDTTPEVFPDNEFAIQIDRGHFTWDKSSTPATLMSIDLRVPVGSLVAVVGPTKSGKSSLLAAIMGHMTRLHGSVKIKSPSFVHLPQQAWVQSSSVKDNVLFGNVKDKRKYSKVIEACCLRQEIDLLHNKDKTEIGERGVLLNDSQKQRVSLARAVYHMADTYFLDEPLADIDSITANQIFANVLSKKGLLRKTTRVLVTANAQWMAQADHVVVLSEGRVAETGHYDQLVERDEHLAQYLRTAGPGGYNRRLGPSSGLEDAGLADSLSLGESYQAGAGFGAGDEFLASIDSTAGGVQRKFELTESTAVEDDIRERERRIREMLLAEEKTEITRMKLSVFWHYLRLLGLAAALSSLAAFLAYQAVSLYSFVWLTTWAGDDQEYHGQHHHAGQAGQPLPNGNDLPTSGAPGNHSSSSHRHHRADFYLGIYGTLGLVQAVFVLIFSALSSRAMTSVTRRLHGQVLAKVTRSPIAFFDQMPPARLLGRFARDVDALDTRLPLHLRAWLNTLLGTVTTVVLVAYCTPVFLALVVPLGVFYYVIQMLYVPTSRQVKNLEATSRECVHQLFRDVISGVSTIRTFEASERFTALFAEKVDKNACFCYAGIATNRWLTVCMEMLGTLVVFATCLFVVGVGRVDESHAGLALTFALQATSALSWMIRALTDLETNVYSVQRMKDLTHLAPEWPGINPSKRPNDIWPHQGTIHFFDCSTHPRPDLYPGLKPLNLYIAGSEKIGILGHFRSECLSIRDALFRIVEATSGSIIIDNIIISDIGVQDLRSRLTYLPGEPVVFLGTLRMNLDPKQLYTDDDLWHALEAADAREALSRHPEGLRFDCGENGSNLSLKQRYQVTLARAILHRRRILIMEESVRVLDPDIEDLIQNTVRLIFQDCTVLTFAQRVNTVVDYDRVMILDNGAVVETDRPHTLLGNPASTFYRMAKEANLVS